MKGRHDRARGLRIVAAVETFTAAHGHPPSLRDLAQTVGLRQPSTVHHHLRLLEAQGLVRGCTCGCGRYHAIHTGVPTP